MNKVKLVAFTFTFSMLLAACGFQLRGTANLPFETIYMPFTTGGIALDLKRNIQSGTNTTVVDDAKKAEAILVFSQDVRQKVILSLSTGGKVSEYRLLYRVSFRVHDGKGGDFLPLNTVQLQRDITFNDADILSKESEELLLYRDMQGDMVQQIMRRLAASQPPKPAAQ